jgi:hypothetical protein
MSFEEDFARCTEMTSLAIKQGAQIHEDIHFNEFDGNILWSIGIINTLQPHQLRQVLKYLLSLGLNIEHRNLEGETPLLYSIRGEFHHSAISAYLDADANLYAEDDEGLDYLHIAMVTLLEGGVLKLGSKGRATLRKNLTVLLKADPRFSGRPITPEETPLIRRLALREQDWNVWMSVFKRLDWNTMGMEAYRYRALLTYQGKIMKQEDQRPRLLEQARSRIGKTKAKEISFSLAGEADSKSDESDENDESNCSDDAEESDESKILRTPNSPGRLHFNGVMATGELL